MSVDPAGFEAHRAYAMSIAYRMLGAVAAAQDVVQDAYLRWHGVHAEVQDPRAYIARIVTRLCLDVLKSARVQREHYVGPWLPEPLVTPFAGPSPLPTTDGQRMLADDISVALLVTLEQLSPLERAAFLLRDVFDLEYAAIADVLERTETACRQLAGRARDHIREKRPRFEATPQAEARLSSAFAQALYSGDMAALTKVLAEDVVVYSDGGGKRKAALRPVLGQVNVQRFFDGLRRKRGNVQQLTAVPARINGAPGFVLHDADGLTTLALAINGDAIAAIYIVRNPDKLQHLQAGPP